MIAAITVAAILLVLGAANWQLRRTKPVSDDALIEAVDRLLPQTQCAQCGYPGCRPYAQALVKREVSPNLCAPGGTEILAQLTALLGESDLSPPTQSHTDMAYIREADCIGCTLCLEPCPVDAIVGAQGYTHTIITNQCTGCELCVAACPVDCIDMVTLAATSTPELLPVENSPACIRCGACIPVCPVSLPVQSLLEMVDRANWPAADQLHVDKCIECGLCDEVCPSLIPLTAHFAYGKQRQAQNRAEEVTRIELKDRYSAHQDRLEAQSRRQADKRQARLTKNRDW
jgi:electron transport complex protein RnfB